MQLNLCVIKTTKLWPLDSEQAELVPQLGRIYHINLDGQVNITDLLLLLAGMGNPNIITSNLTVPLNTNHQLIGPEITVSQSIVLTIPTGSVLSIT